MEEEEEEEENGGGEKAGKEGKEPESDSEEKPVEHKKLVLASAIGEVLEGVMEKVRYN